MRRLMEKSGFDGIIDDIHDVPDLPNHQQVLVFHPEQSVRKVIQ